MARQCPRGRPGTAEGSLHWRRRRSIGSTHRGRFHLCRSATQTPCSKHREEIRRGVKLKGDKGRRNPSRIQLWISSERWILPNPFGGGGRGRRGKHLAQGGGNGGRRRWPESPSDGEAIWVRRRESSGEREKVSGAEWAASV
jgi:hypothetical protein